MEKKNEVVVLMEKIEEVAESLGWTFDFEKVSHADYVTVQFRTYTELGQDFGFVLVFDDEASFTLDNVLSKTEHYYENFDCSYETYLWLDDEGHGKNGAPYDMIDVYKDMEDGKDKIKELYQELIRLYGKEKLKKGE